MARLHLNGQFKAINSCSITLFIQFYCFVSFSVKAISDSIRSTKISRVNSITLKRQFHCPGGCSTPKKKLCVPLLVLLGVQILLDVIIRYKHHRQNMKMHAKLWFLLENEKSLVNYFALSLSFFSTLSAKSTITLICPSKTCCINKLFQKLDPNKKNVWSGQQTLWKIQIMYIYFYEW